jgi:hypothetical protein
LDQDADDVAENLVQDLVYLPRIALASQGTLELALYHAVGSLDVAPLVVVIGLAPKRLFESKYTKSSEKVF